MLMMNNNACIFALSKAPGADTLRATESLKHTAAGYFDNISAKAFSSVNLMLGQLGARLTDNRAVLIAVEPRLFYNAKLSLCKALSVPMERQDDVIAALPAAYSPKTRQEYEIVTEFPKGSKIFITDNGLFTGFALEANKQVIALLPLELSRLSPMLRDEVNPYFAALTAKKKPPVIDIEEPFATETLPDDIPEETAPQPIAEEPAETAEDIPVSKGTDPAPAEPSAHEEEKAVTPVELAAKQMVDGLQTAGKRIALCLCGSVDPLRSLFGTVAGNETVVTFDTVEAERWTSGAFNDYFAAVTKTTLERVGTPLAGAVSPLYSEKGEKFMFFAVARREGAKIVKIARPEETPSEEVACDCVIAFAKEVLALAAETEDSLPKALPTQKITYSKLPLWIGLGVILAALIAAAVIGFSMKDRFNPAPVTDAATGEYETVAATETLPEVMTVEEIPFEEETALGEEIDTTEQDGTDTNDSAESGSYTPEEEEVG